MASGGETRLLDPSGRPFLSLEEFTHWSGFARRHAELGITPPESDETADVAPLLAHISDDCWQVDCPDCGGAEVVWLNDRRIWCHRCGNAAVGGLYRPVELPTMAEEIERILSYRPRRDYRNWSHTETLDDVRRHNEEAGDRY